MTESIKDKSKRLKTIGEEINELILSNTRVRFPERLKGARRVSGIAFTVNRTNPGRYYTYRVDYKKGGTTGVTYLGPWIGSEEDRERVLVLSRKYRELYEELKKKVMVKVA
jgi:hypothetical protein